MAKIAVLIGKDFEDSEYAQPAEAFKKADYKLVHIGLKQGDTVTGKKQNTPVQIDMAVDDANPREFDALLIPGGYSRIISGLTRDLFGSSGSSWRAASRFLPFVMDLSF